MGFPEGTCCNRGNLLLDMISDDNFAVLVKFMLSLNWTRIVNFMRSFLYYFILIWQNQDNSSPRFWVNIKLRRQKKVEGGVGSNLPRWWNKTSFGLRSPELTLGTSQKQKGTVDFWNLWRRTPLLRHLPSQTEDHLRTSLDRIAGELRPAAEENQGQKVGECVRIGVFKWGPQTSIISIISKLIRNANFWLIPVLLNQKFRARATGVGFNRPSWQF